MLLLFSSCAVSVESLDKASQHYQTKDIRLNGYILEAHHIPLTSLSLYTLYDGSGKILVLDLRGKKPYELNKKVSVKGSFFYLGIKGRKKEQNDFKRFLKKNLLQSVPRNKFSDKFFDITYQFTVNFLKKHANLAIVIMTE